ncbi:hypothetical protein L1887_24032 [Cichorium endivia]|nr:hypothetical protein L1887_24032 [Cichorium endivia]
MRNQAKRCIRNHPFNSSKVSRSKTRTNFSFGGDFIDMSNENEMKKLQKNLIISYDATAQSRLISEGNTSNINSRTDELKLENANGCSDLALFVVDKLPESDKSYVTIASDTSDCIHLNGIQSINIGIDPNH